MGVHLLLKSKSPSARRETTAHMFRCEDGRLHRPIHGPITAAGYSPILRRVCFRYRRRGSGDSNSAHMCAEAQMLVTDWLLYGVVYGAVYSTSRHVSMVLGVWEEQDRWNLSAAAIHSDRCLYSHRGERNSGAGSHPWSSSPPCHSQAWPWRYFLC